MTDSESLESVPKPKSRFNFKSAIARAMENEEVEEEELAYSAAHVTSILKPVTVTMMLVAWLVQTLGRNNIGGSAGGYGMMMVYEEKETDSTAERLGGSVLNAAMFVGFITLFTGLFVILYKYRCTKIIYGWLAFSVFTLLGGSGSLLLMTLLNHYQIIIDNYTFLFLLFNFAVVGTVAIFYHSPAIVKQIYLVLASIIMAWVLTKLPSWTNWSLLAALALYDIVAVLSPCGPLKALVEMSQERNEPIPGLVYEASAPARPTQNAPPPRAQRQPAPVAEIRDGARRRQDSGNEVELMESGRADASEEDYEASERQDSRLLSDAAHNLGEDAHENVSSSALAPAAEFGYEEDDDEDRSVKLGLGDFVFYSVLVGRAADSDIATTVTCFIGILTGLCATLFLLAIFHKALPALPISIFLGMIFYFLTTSCVVPWTNDFSMLHIYI